MPDILLRKLVVQVEEIFHEGGPPRDAPARRAAVLAVIANPFAGRYVDVIQGFMDDLKPLGLTMARRLLAALGDDSTLVEGYGKGGIVGSAGELEHAALWHNPGGYAMREVLGGTQAIVPSTKKVGGPGTGSTCRSPTSTRPTCAAISTRSRSAFPMRRARPNSFSSWP